MELAIDAYVDPFSTTPGLIGTYDNPIERLGMIGSPRPVPEDLVEALAVVSASRRERDRLAEEELAEHSRTIASCKRHRSLRVVDRWFQMVEVLFHHEFCWQRTPCSSPRAANLRINGKLCLISRRISDTLLHFPCDMTGLAGDSSDKTHKWQIFQIGH